MPSSAVVIYAHPYPDRSRANRKLLARVTDMERVQVRSLSTLYPDFAIDVDAEQKALTEAQVVVWHHPIYWYGVPALLKLWFDKVLEHGWAYGKGGTALRGKRCLWVTTAGGDERAYRPGGMHGHPFSTFVPPIEQTARFCGMEWEDPIIVIGAHRSEATLAEAADYYRARLEELLAHG